MVRINLIDPKNLTDQHLIAEYREILSLLGFTKKRQNAKKVPKRMGEKFNHWVYFKNKLLYIEKRFKLIKKEMIKRGFKPRFEVSLEGYKKSLLKDWKPSKEDVKIIKARIIERIKLKPKFYRYYKEYRSKTFLINLIKKAKVKP